MTYEFRHFDLDRDIRPYIELCREVLAVEFSWELLSWKNRDVRNPDRPPKIYLAIGEEGDIAGAISFFPMHLKFRGADYFAALAGDVMVAHRHRRKGLFKRLIAYGEVELERIGCRLIYGFPNVAAHPGWQSMEYVTSYMVTSYFRPLRSKNLVARKVPALGVVGAILDPIVQLVLAAATGSRSGRALEITVDQTCGAVSNQDIADLSWPDRIHQ